MTGQQNTISEVKPKVVPCGSASPGGGVHCFHHGTTEICYLLINGTFLAARLQSGFGSGFPYVTRVLFLDLLLHPDSGAVGESHENQRVEGEGLQREREALRHSVFPVVSPKSVSALTCTTNVY